MLHARKVLIAVLLMLTLALSSCTVNLPQAAPSAGSSTGSVTPDGEMTLSVMHSMSPDEAKSIVFDEILDAFMAAHPNITVSVEIVPDTDIALKAETAFVGGVEPDLVFHNYPLESANWIIDGMTIDLSEYLGAWDLSNTFYPSALEGYTTTDGQLAALPIEGFTWPVWYNTAIFEAAGVEIPQTIDDLTQAATALRAAGYQPFATGGSDWTGARLFMLILSAHVSPAEFERLLMEGGYAENPAAVAAIENFVAMREAGVFVDDAEGLEFSSMNEMFFAGEAAMMHGGSWSFGEAPEDIVGDIVLGGFPLPADSPHANPVMFGGFGAKAIHVTRNGSENLAAIEPFVRYFYQPDVFVGFVNETGMVAPVKNLPVDGSKVPPLFADSLSLPETTDFAGNPDLTPPDITAQWDQIANDAYIPGDMGAEEIVAALDALYQ